MRYARIKLKEKNDEIAYRIYISDCLRLTAENIARSVNGSYPTTRYFDMIRPKPNVDAEEIVKNVISGAGLVVSE